MKICKLKKKKNQRHGLKNLSKQKETYTKASILEFGNLVHKNNEK